MTFSSDTLLSRGSSSRNVYLRSALNAPPDKEGRIKESGPGYINHVRENFLEAMEIPLLAGRTLQAQDDARGPKVVIVNQTFASRYFPNENPVGKRFAFASNKPDEFEIVGLAKDAKYTQAAGRDSADGLSALAAGVALHERRNAWSCARKAI